MMNSPISGTKFSVVASSTSSPLPVFSRWRSPIRKANAEPTPEAASEGTPEGRVVQAEVGVGADVTPCPASASMWTPIVC